MKKILLLFLFCIGALMSSGTTYVVTDTTNGTTTDGVSLRWAITQANSNSAHDTIVFNIAGIAPHTIVITSALPDVDDYYLVMDGSSQPANGYPGTAPKIIISNADTVQDGLYFFAPQNALVKGVQISNFLDAGIYAFGSSIFMTVDSCKLSNNNEGITILGSNANTLVEHSELSSNTADGVYIFGAAAHGVIEHNLISGNGNNGIEISGGSDSTTVQGNYIGTDASGTQPWPNGQNGVSISNNSNLIGGMNPGDGNIIAFNGNSGVYFSYGNYNLISRNSMFCNTVLGINLGSSGNNNYAAPVITNATTVSAQGTATAGARIELFYDSSCTSCQGKSYIATVYANGSGMWNYIGALLAGSSVTATASDTTNNNTSKFSVCVTVITASCNASVSASVIQNVSCFGACDGEAVAIASGGTAPYTYSWIPSSCSGPTCTGLCAGPYAVEVTDAVGCTAMSTVISITQPSGLMDGWTTINNVSCNGANDGSAVLTVSGGNGPYTYNWSPSGGNGPSVSNLSPGCYTVNISDANGCTTSTTVCITQPPAITIADSVLHSVSCNGGSDGVGMVTVSGGTPGYTYDWLGSGCSGATCSNLTWREHTIVIHDSNGCQMLDTIYIPQPSQPLNIFILNSNIPCAPDPVCVSAAVLGGTPSFTYTWLPSGGNSTTMCTTVNGTYTISVTDANGCTASDMVSIAQPTPVTVSTTITDASCSSCCDGAVSVSSVSGGIPGYTYGWSPVSSTADSIGALCPGIYTVTVTDMNGCTEIAFDTVSYPTNISIATNGGFTIHPNPFTNQLTITQNLKSVTTITLSDITGKAILVTKAKDEETVINTEGIAAGIYFLRVESGGSVRNYKIAKE